MATSGSDMMIQPEAANILIIVFLGVIFALVVNLCKRSLGINDIESAVQAHQIVLFEGNMGPLQDMPIHLSTHFENMLSTGNRLPAMPMKTIESRYHLKRDTLRLKAPKQRERGDSEFKSLCFAVDAAERFQCRLFWGVSRCSVDELLGHSFSARETAISLNLGGEYDFESSMSAQTGSTRARNRFGMGKYRKNLSPSAATAGTTKPVVSVRPKSPLARSNSDQTSKSAQAPTIAVAMAKPGPTPINGELSPSSLVEWESGLDFCPSVTCALALPPVYGDKGTNIEIEACFEEEYESVIAAACNIDYDQNGNGNEKEKEEEKEKEFALEVKEKLIPLCVCIYSYSEGDGEGNGQPQLIEVSLVSFVGKKRHDPGVGETEAGEGEGEGNGDSSALSLSPSIPVPVVFKQILRDKEKGSSIELHEVFSVSGSGNNECVVCLCELKCVILLPCRHFCVCKECFEKISTCPVCRATHRSFVAVQPEKSKGDSISPAVKDV